MSIVKINFLKGWFALTLFLWMTDDSLSNLLQVAEMDFLPFFKQFY